MSRQVWKGSTLLNPEPPVLVSCGPLDKPNLITVGWCGTICTQPSMLSISVRPERYSYDLIKDSGEFVVNLPTEPLTRAVDWCGVKSGRDVDKVKACGLTVRWGAGDTPFFDEAEWVLVCRKLYAQDMDPACVLGEGEIEILIHLHMGQESAQAYGCDLTYDYVKINGDYRT